METQRSRAYRTPEHRVSFLHAAAQAVAVAFAGLNQAGLQAAHRSFPADFARIDAGRTGRSRNDLRPGQSVCTYPANGARAMARRVRQMQRAEAKRAGGS